MLKQTRRIKMGFKENFPMRLVMGVFCGSILFSAACRPGNNLKENLEKNCLWDIYEKDYPDGAHSGYRFKENGECWRFDYRFSNGIRTNTVMLGFNDDVIVSHTWGIEDDKIIYIEGFKARIFRYSEDSVFLSIYNQDRDTMLLLRNCKAVSNSRHF